MIIPSYKQALGDSKKELRELVIQRDRINARIEQVQAGITGLANMLDDPDDALAELVEMQEIVGTSGITDAIRGILLADTTGAVWTPVGVRDYLRDRLNFDLSKYSNDMATVHTILKRLARTESIEEIDGGYRRKRGAEHPINKLRFRHPVSRAPFFATPLGKALLAARSEREKKDKK